MKIYEVILNIRQYMQLKAMLIDARKANLVRKQPIDGFELFCDMMHEIYSPVADGWSTLEIVMKESEEELSLLRFMTKQVYPEDENHFVKQLGKKTSCIQCKKDFAFQIYKREDMS